MKSLFDFLSQLINKLHLKELTLILFFILFWYLVFPDWAVQIFLNKTPKYFPDWLTLVEPAVLCLSLICTLLFDPVILFCKRERVRFLTRRSLKKLSDVEKALLVSILLSPKSCIFVDELSKEAKSLWHLCLITHRPYRDYPGYIFTIANKTVYQVCCEVLLH